MKKPFGWLLLVAVSLILSCGEKNKNVLQVTGTIKNLDKITGSFAGIVK
jgi:hypothetical protein